MFKVFPWILQVILLPFFEKIRLESRYKDRLEEAKNKGMVIYTMKTHSIIALLYFNFLAIRWNLPLAEFISGISRWRLHPLEFVGRFFGKINDSPDSAEEACKRGCHMLIFLRGDQEFSPTRNEDPFSAVVDEIRKTGSQIQIVPQVFLFDRMPEEFRKSWFANLLGVRETLGFIREWFLFLRNHKKTVIKIGNSFDLTEFVGQNEHLPTHRLAKKVRLTLSYHLSKEEEVIRGPIRKGAQLIKRLCLKDKKLAEKVNDFCKKEGMTEEKAWGKVSRYFNEIAADMSLRYVQGFSYVLEKIFNSVYSGLTYNDEDLLKIERVMKNHPVILCPTHKSHMDYLILSYIFYTEKIVPPIIAAGKNLTFWPMGHFFRHAGAFFLRRSFKGNILYSETFKTYLKHTLRTGYCMEFFIEGGRSRTGKLLQPKMGMVDMFLESGADLPSKNFAFMPISVNYEVLVEQKSYSVELKGGEKKKENLMGMLKNVNILKKRFGRVHVHFGDPVFLDDFLEGRKVDKKSLVLKDKRKPITQFFAHELISKMSKGVCVTPSSVLSTILLNNQNRAMEKESLVENSKLLIEFLSEFSDPNYTPSLQVNSPQELGPVFFETLEYFKEQEFLRVFHSSHGELLNLPEEKRIMVEYYKNTLINKVIGYSFIICSKELKDIPDALQQLYSIFSLEFIFPRIDFNGKYFKDLEKKLSKKESKAILAQKEGFLFRLLQRLLQPFVESYLSLAELIVESPSFAQAREKKVILEEALEICNTRYYFGSNQRIESANKSTLENVLKFFQNEGILSLSQGQGAKRTFHYKLENRARLLEIKTFLEKVNFHLGSLKDI